MEEEFYLYWISSLPGAGIKHLKKWRDYFGSFAELYEEGRRIKKPTCCTEKEWELFTDEERKRQAVCQWREIKQKGITYLSYFDLSQYPQCLRQIPQPPKHLFVKGKCPDGERISIAIVGARECSPYGRDMARLFGYRLAEAGINVISGMARGIDGWGHQGALESGGNTFAVLGCGVEVCYPAEHRRLYDSIAIHGGIISEFPINMKAQKPFFPLRNRIISGLSQGILVVEAKERSGSLITADAALEQGKDVFVIPGRIGDVLSEGCNRLIRQGAIPVLSPMDILEYYGICCYNNIEETVREGADLVSMIGLTPIHINVIMRQSHRTPSDVLKTLSKLKKKGMIREVSRGYFIKC